MKRRGEGDVRTWEKGVVLAHTLGHVPRLTFSSFRYRQVVGRSRQIHQLNLGLISGKYGFPLNGYVLKRHVDVS